MHMGLNEHFFFSFFYGNGFANFPEHVNWLISQSPWISNLVSVTRNVLMICRIYIYFFFHFNCLPKTVHNPFPEREKGSTLSLQSQQPQHVNIAQTMTLKRSEVSPLASNYTSVTLHWTLRAREWQRHRHRDNNSILKKPPRGPTSNIVSIHHGDYWQIGNTPDEAAITM